MQKDFEQSFRKNSCGIARFPCDGTAFFCYLGYFKPADGDDHDSPLWATAPPDRTIT